MIDINQTCNPHPDAPHGFDRESSIIEDRYVCECESWQPTSKWVGLTDEEVANAWAQSKGDMLLRLKSFAKAIEDLLKEKNT